MDKKTFIGFLLFSVLIIGGWHLFTWIANDRQAPPGAQAPPPPVRPQEGGREALPSETAAGQPPLPGREIEVPEDVEEAHFTLGNEVIETSWTNRGAALESLRLLRYKAPYSEEGLEERPVLTLLRDFQEGYYGDLIEAVTFLAPPGREGLWREDVSTERVLYEMVSGGEDALVFEGVLDPRLAVRKSISIAPDTHHYEVELEFINRTDGPLRFTYRLRGPAGIEREALKSPYLAAVAGVREGGSYHVAQVGALKLRGGNRLNESAGILWGGLVSQYFVAFLQPERPDRVKAVESKLVVDTDIAEGRGRWKEATLDPKLYRNRAQLARSNATTVIHSAEVNLPPAGTLAHRYWLVAAPVLKEALEPYGAGITRALRSASLHKFTRYLSFGTIDYISPLMLGILKGFYSVVRNYGVAILMLTLLVRIALHPLTRMSQTSMRKMQALQPKLAEIQKKYKDDKQRQVQEQMTLYRRYGVHPMSGCWPMFLQMPVFIALFVTLRTAVQLRQAPFIPGWISDLSRPDTVWHFPFFMWILGNELNILPFLMAGAWMLNQKFMPKPADPRAQQQQQFMKWFPLFFAVMLYHFASGLLLYWTASSALGILEQWLIRRRMAGMELTPVGQEQKPKKRTPRPSEARKPGLLGRVVRQIEEQQKKSEKVRSSKSRKRR